MRILLAIILILKQVLRVLKILNIRKIILAKALTKFLKIVALQLIKGKIVITAIIVVIISIKIIVIMIFM